MASSHTDTAVQADCSSLPAPPVRSFSGILRSSSSIARQTSIYALTLDEFQNVLGEPSKSFGSMNMDEFLKNIWTVEESQAMAAAMGTGVPTSDDWTHGVQQQAPISLPRTVSRKTVDDVWKDITCGSIEMDSIPAHERQATFGEMTLEDFLIKAGVVKQDDSGSVSLLPFGTSFENPFGAMAAGDNNKLGDKSGETNAPYGSMKDVEGEKPSVTALPTLSLSAGASMPGSQKGLEAMPIESMNHVSPVIQPPEWLSKSAFKADINYAHPPVNNTFHRCAMDASARKGGVNGGNIGGPGVPGADLGAHLVGTSPSSLALKTGSPQSPLCDGVVPSYDSMALQSPLPYGVDGIVRGRKRDFEGSLEKVVERRQKRMIKNRESAARSRARKQAYTVELEAEVSHLKEENMRLRRYEEEMAERRRRQLIDVLTSFGPKFMPKACRLRRTHTGPW